ncbi:MAG: hypothetical protein R3D78_11580 [Paracoccaceae bacterium]
MILWQEPWVWIVAGVALAGLEMLLPGFILLGFAVGAVVVGVLIWAGLLGGSLAPMLFVFAVFSLIAWIGLRRFVGVQSSQTKVWDTDINEN